MAFLTGASTRFLLICATLAATSLAPAATILGYTETTVASGFGLGTMLNARPSGLALTSDGRALIAKANGQILVVQNGVTLATPALTIDVLNSADRGLVDVAIDPNFSSNGFVYVYYQDPDPSGTTFQSRLSRFTMTGNTIAPASEVVLKEMPAVPVSTSIYHMGGGITFGADGKIYLGVGDHLLSGNPAHNLGSFFGKILRLNPDGTAPLDNPFVSTPGALGEIYAYGVRNPFSIEAQTGTGRLLVNDVGDETAEEINDLASGANFGWNGCEGPCADPSAVNPLYSYAHNQALPRCSGAVVGGTFSDTLGAGFVADSYYFADYCSETIRRINLTGTITESPLATGVGAVIATAAAPGGGLYYLTLANDGSLVHISAVPEPSTLLLLTAGLAAICWKRRP
jgi:glucose/arabinose dehydrogenase